VNEFKLPDVGEGLTEAEIITWKVQVGDIIKVNDIIVDIETAKSLVELPSPYEGRIDALLVPEGATVPVGTPIIAISDPSEAPGSSPERAKIASSAGSELDLDRDKEADAGGGQESVEAAVVAAGEERQAVLVGYGPRTGASKRRVRKQVGGRVPAGAVASVDTEKVKQRIIARPIRALAKPPVRKLAKDLGVDLATIESAGDIITRADVEACANGSAAPAATGAPNVTRGDQRIPIKGVRKMTAEAMVASAFTAPHVTEWLTLDVTPTMDLVAQLKADPSFADVKVSPLLIVAKAVCLAMRRTPELNSTWDDAAQEIVVKGSINLGIAAATPRGLVVPNIPSAESLSLHDLAAALGELTATARAGKIQPAQMSGGSFTITNIGVFGIDAGTPILNPGEAGILAIGAINKRPWIGEDDTIVARWVTTLAMSFDHRVVDGEQGSCFLADVGMILSNPALALTF